MVSVSAFITSLVTSTLIFVLLLLFFVLLKRRPGNRVVYYPALLLAGEVPPEKFKKRSSSWIQEAWQASEESVIAIAGLDAVIYIKFFTTMLEILSLTALFCFPVLIPLALTDDNNKQPTIAGGSKPTKLDNLSMSNIKDKSPRIWAFVAGGYWMSIVTYLALLKSYRYVIELRSREQGALKAKPEHFSVLVRDIPSPSKNESRSEQVDFFFRKCHPDTFERALVVSNLSKASKLWTNLETNKQKLEHSEAVLALAKGKNQPENVEKPASEGTTTEGKVPDAGALTTSPKKIGKKGKNEKKEALVDSRPSHKTGKFGLYGKKVDSIDFYNEKIKELTPLLEEEQKGVSSKHLGAAFVFFNTRRAAAEAAQARHAPHASNWTVMAAPEPREVVWDNLTIGFFQRMGRALVVYVIVFFTVVFYMVPIALISALTSLDNLTTIVPFIKTITKIKPLNAILQAYLPQLALIIFLALLPKLLLALSKAEGIPARSHLTRAAAGKMYYFVVFNVFLGITIFGTIFQSADSIKQLNKAGGLSVSSVITLFGKSLPPNSTYFITYIALKFLVGYGMQLMRLVPLLLYHIKRKYLCKTERELQAAWAPGAFGYNTSVPGDLLVVTITMCYSVIAPLILPFALLYFGIGWFVVRNQALKVYVPNYESGGRMWPHIHNRILASLFISQITMLGFFGIKKFVPTFVLVPLPLFSIFFYQICKNVYYPSFQAVSLVVASEEAKEVPTVQAIADAYTPICLLNRTEEEEFEDASYKDAHSNITSRTSSGITSPA